MEIAQQINYAVERLLSFQEWMSEKQKFKQGL
jgi:hypothetical protein